MRRNDYFLCTALALCVAAFYSGCSFERRELSGGGVEQTSKIDELVLIQPQYQDFKIAFNSYLSSLRNKDLRALYDLRASDFRELVSFEVYRREMDGVIQNWSIDEYVVYGVKLYSNIGVRLVVASKERGVRYHGVALWAKEGDGWKCVADGLHGLPMSDILIDPMFVRMLSRIGE